MVQEKRRVSKNCFESDLAIQVGLTAAPIIYDYWKTRVKKK